MRILFLTPQFPYPPHKGTTLRNYNLIAGLAPRHEIDLLSSRMRRRLLHRSINSAAASPLCRFLGVPTGGARWIRCFRRGRTWDCVCGRTQFQQQLAAWLRDGAYDVIQVEGLELARYASPPLPLRE